MSPDVSNTCVCEILKLSRLVANNRIATGKSFIDFFLNNEVFMFGIISVTQGVLTHQSVPNYTRGHTESCIKPLPRNALPKYHNNECEHEALQDNTWKHWNAQLPHQLHKPLPPKKFFSPYSN